MRAIKTILTTMAILIAAISVNAQTYTPSEGNIQARKDFVNERFGIFLHWGIYASYAQGEWYLNTGKLNKDEYAKEPAMSQSLPVIMTGSRCLTPRHLTTTLSRQPLTDGMS